MGLLENKTDYTKVDVRSRRVHAVKSKRVKYELLERVKKKRIKKVSFILRGYFRLDFFFVLFLYRDTKTKIHRHQPWLLTHQSITARGRLSYYAKNRNCTRGYELGKLNDGLIVQN